MKTIRLVLLLTAVYGYVNAYNCIEDADCQNDEKCLPGCEKNAATPACDTTCTGTNACFWLCKDDSGSTVNGNTQICSADVTSCGEDVTCTAECEAPQVCAPTCGDGEVCSKICQAPKSGSPRMELFTPLLVLGTLIRMCFYP